MHFVRTWRESSLYWMGKMGNPLKVFTIKISLFVTDRPEFDTDSLLHNKQSLILITSQYNSFLIHFYLPFPSLTDYHVRSRLLLVLENVTFRLTWVYMQKQRLSAVLNWTSNIRPQLVHMGDMGYKLDLFSRSVIQYTHCNVRRQYRQHSKRNNFARQLTRFIN